MILTEMHVGSCEPGFGSMKVGEFLERLSDYKVFKVDPVPSVSLVRCLVS